MTRHQLAEELRERQYTKGYVDKKLIDIISDDKIIDSYITCSCCGEKQVDSEQLETAIAIAKDSDQFLDLCEQISMMNHGKAKMEDSDFGFN